MHIDVIVVAFRSARHLRGCVEPLAGQPDISVVVVDNACPERSSDTVRDLPLEILPMGRNAGFGVGCNAGAARGEGDAILFLNPDARIEPDGVRRLAQVLVAHPGCGAVAPHLLEADGETQLSVRRTPRLRSAFSEALFLHHVAPRAPWATEMVHDGYDRPQEVEWLTGAALMVRRSAFTQLGGFDERLFMYSEDTDLCERLRRAGYRLRYEPGVTAHHEGAASAPAPMQAALMVEARLVYARLHERLPRRLAFRVAYGLGELVRIPVAATRSRAHVQGRLSALAVALGRSAPRAPGRTRQSSPAATR